MLLTWKLYYCPSWKFLCTISFHKDNNKVHNIILKPLTVKQYIRQRSHKSTEARVNKHGRFALVTDSRD